MSTFRSLELAIELYRECKQVKLTYSMKDQLIRASSSVALNLAEGNQRHTTKDKRKFFNIALTSLREVQCIIKMEELKRIEKKADQLGAMVFSLNRNLNRKLKTDNRAPIKEKNYSDLRPGVPESSSTDARLSASSARAFM
jgi:four helix bundle protein